jgi:hypothetical protein
MKYPFLLSGACFGAAIALFGMYAAAAPAAMFVVPSVLALVYVGAMLYTPRGDIRTLGVQDIGEAIARSSSFVRVAVGAGVLTSLACLAGSIVIFREYRADENLGVYLAQLMMFLFAIVTYLFAENLHIATHL